MALPASLTSALLRWVCCNEAPISTATISTRHKPASRVIFQAMDRREGDMVNDSINRTTFFLAERRQAFRGYRHPRLSPERFGNLDAIFL